MVVLVNNFKVSLTLEASHFNMQRTFSRISLEEMIHLLISGMIMMILDLEASENKRVVARPREGRRKIMILLEALVSTMMMTLDISEVDSETLAISVTLETLVEEVGSRLSKHSLVAIQHLGQLVLKLKHSFKMAKR